jgi:hypothetical protein
VSRLKFILAFGFVIWGGCVSSSNTENSIPDESGPMVDEEGGFAKPLESINQDKVKKFEEKQKQKKEFFSSQGDSKSGGEAGPFPVVVKMTQNSPVFVKPAASSRILADVSAGTTLIARKQTPKGFWLLLEDEEGNKGWVPETRTNFKVLLSKIQSGILATNSGATPSAVESAFDSKAQESTNTGPELFSGADESPEGEPLSISVVSLKIEKVGYGFGYSFLSPMSRDSRNIDRLQRIGFEVAVNRSYGAGLFDSAQTTVFGKIRMLNQTEGQNFGAGPDFGFLYKIESKVWGPGLGYSLGYVPAWNSGLLLLIRAGLDWPSWDPTPNIGVELGWVF